MPKHSMCPLTAGAWPGLEILMKTRNKGKGGCEKPHKASMIQNGQRSKLRRIRRTNTNAE